MGKQMTLTCFDEEYEYIIPETTCHFHWYHDEDACRAGVEYPDNIIYYVCFCERYAPLFGGIWMMSCSVEGEIEEIEWTW